MSLDVCIPGLVAEGKLTKEQGDEAAALYGEIKRRLSSTMSEPSAAALASERTVEALDRKAKLNKYQALKQIAAQKDAIVQIANYDKGSGKYPGEARIALFVRDDRAADQTHNVENRHITIRSQALAGLDRFLLKHHRGVLGRIKDPAGLDDMVREAFGERTGNTAAHTFNDAWQAAAEWLRQRRNAAGGATDKLADWGLPQSHDSLKVMQAAGPGADMAASSQAWRDYITPMLDRDRMLDSQTGLKMSDKQFGDALRGVFDTIATDGWSDRQPGGQMGIGKLANQRADQRFLIFKDADSWIQYQQRFGGGGTPFDVMMSHIDNVSREVAMMEILGPNPSATVRWLQDGLSKGAALSGDAKVRAGVFGPKARIQRLYNELTGANMAPESRALAVTFGTIRNLQTASKLGSAVITSLNHMTNQFVTRAYNGLPVVKMMDSFLRQLNPASHEDRAFAIRMSLGADDMARAMGDDSRLGFAEQGLAASRLMASFTLHASGLEAMVRANKYSFGMDAINALTGNSVRTWDALDNPFRSMLQRYGIDSASWDSIRDTPLEQERGAHWLKPGSIEDPALRDRVVSMILSETARVVPTDNLRVRAEANGLFPRGNIVGELGRSAFQFKGFATSNLTVQWRRMMSASTLPPKLAYAVGYSALAVAIGVFTNELREVVKGNDPRPLSDPSLWLQGGMSGLALGIYGDFINSATSRTGGKVLDALSGPFIETGDNIGKLIVDTGKSALGYNANPGRDLSRLSATETPYLSSTWYTRAAYDRALMYFLQEGVDPDHAQSFRAMANRAKQQGQDMWWKPGEPTPDRAPDFANAFNGAVPPTHPKH